MPTNKEIKYKGVSMSSMCSLCKQYVENTFHIFFECHISLWILLWLQKLFS